MPSKEANELLRNASAPNTLRSYSSALDRLSMWLENTRRDLTNDSLTEYCAYLHTQRKLSFSSVQTVCAAVRFLCQQRNIQQIRAEPGVISGIRRDQRGRGRGQVVGVRHDRVQAIAELILREDSLRSKRDAAILTLASDALLRVSEVSDVERKDIQFLEDGSGRLTIPFAKADPFGHGSTAYLGRSTCDHLRIWFDATGISEGRAFRRLSKAGRVIGCSLSERSIRTIIHKRCKQFDVDGRISGHSLRIGTAESLAERGAGLTEMMTAGRWRSPSMPAYYTRNQLAQRSAVARLLYGEKRWR